MRDAPPLSICEFSTIGASFEEDLVAYAAAGAGGIGICEFKLGDDALDRKRLRESGLAATHCVPAVPSILPLPLIEGPADPEERVEAICASIRRLAAFDPVCCLCLTGPAGEQDETEARRIVVEGLRRIGEDAARAGVRMSVEPIQREFAHLWTLVSSIPETVELLEDVGRPELQIFIDTWHLWNTPTLMEDIGEHVGRFAGIHVADWREPTRSTNDRVLPGDGVADLPAILGALDGAGYAGWYDVEIFSDAELQDSLWKLDPGELARRARAAFDRAWQARSGASSR
jgi:sugar phosphate isomerase/epimerase